MDSLDDVARKAEVDHDPWRDSVQLLDEDSSDRKGKGNTRIRSNGDYQGGHPEKRGMVAGESEGKITIDNLEWIAELPAAILAELGMIFRAACDTKTHSVEP